MIATTNNRISSISGSLTRSYGYDAAGNTTGDGTATYTYDDAGRMVSATKAGVTAAYKLNALGQRVRKTISAVHTYFVYDEAGHLLGEYDNAGSAIQETVWLGDTPVATLRPNGSGGVDVFNIHTDHLNTPRRITRPSDNATVWRWDSDPFGTTAPNQNPSGLGAFIYNFRFPGQYADSETGLNYNFFRDYDPATGGFTQSDPIGIAGGLNTYRYSFNDPVSYFDPYGLDAEVGVRKFFPVPVPYARHCFIRFNQNDNDTLSFDDKGVHVDPNPKGADMSPTIGKENDSCVREKMKECKGSQYDFLDFNCCMCVSNALHACGLKKQGPWPNAPRDASKPPYKPEVPKPDPKNPPKK